MKRILLLFSALMLSCIALWAHDVEIDGIYYNLDKTNKTAKVTCRGDDYYDYDNEYSGSVSIPSSITYNAETYSVTSIGGGAFYDCSGLTEVTIPNSVTSIGSSAFSGCWGLTSVTIPNSVTFIGSGTFRYCSGLTSVTIGESVTSIGEYAFEGCSKLTSVTIPNSVTSIGEYAFKNCSGLTSVTIPNSVTSIGEFAFSGCSKLTSVTIPNSVTSIGEYAFKNCSGLTSVIWNAKNYQNSYTGFGNQVTSFTFGNEVEHIPAFLCYGMSKLTEMTIPNSVTSIGSRAFYGCSGLTSVTIPNSVTSISWGAFSGCSGLTSVTIGDNVTSIYDGAFENCSGLTKVTIPNSVTSIGSDAFNGTGIYNNESNWDNGMLYIDNCLIEAKSDVVNGSYTIKEGTRVIASAAFNGCSGLTSVTIPNSVTSIGYNAFEGCSGLTKVNYLGNVEKWVEFDFNYSNHNPTYYAKDLYINNELLTDVKITTADSIKNYAFYNCQSIKSAEIGNSVTSIGWGAFSGCSGLTSVIWNAKNYKDFEDYYETPFYDICSSIASFTFGNEVEHIPEYLCYGMSKLTEVTIPNSVTSIGGSAFYGCSGLTSVIWNDKNCEDFKYDSYYNTSTSPFYNISSNITSFTFGNEVEHTPAYLCYGMSKLTEMTIPNSVTSIGSSAFSGCSGLTSLTIPNSVTSIGLWAFSNCSRLTSVIWNAKNCEGFGGFINSIPKIPFYNTPSITSFTFGNEVEHIPAYLCYEMRNLKEVTIGNSVTSIGSAAFSDCSGLTEVTIPNNVTSIGDEAFSGCSGLTSVIWNAKNCKDTSSSYAPFYDIRSNITSFTFGNEVEHIPAHLCHGMGNLKEVTIGNSVTSIGYAAFSDCSGLTKVNYLGTVDQWAEINFDYEDANPMQYAASLYINSKLLEDLKITQAEAINTYAFVNCQSIKSVEIGESVTLIRDDAFYGCSGLTSITIPNSVTSIGDDAFYGCSGLTSVIIPNSVTSIGSSAFSGCSRLTSVTIPNSVTYIGSGAFEDCSELKSVSIGESVNTIGSGAFAGCDNLKKITMYPMNVPNMEGTDIFAHYNAYLYVPCDVYEDYDLDDVFGNFKYVKCIAADEVDAPDKVEIDVDNDNNATITWPSTDGAKSYELEITKNGNVFCTLLFNKDGQLTSIDFGNRSASVGFQFTVTGLEEASKYDYVIEAKDKVGNVLKSYKGTFTTNGYNSDTAILETLADANITVSGGMISADKEFSIYNTLGKDVTALNGNLQPGIYVVVLGEDRVKVMVK